MIASKGALTGDSSKVCFFIQTDHNLPITGKKPRTLALSAYLNKVIRSFPELDDRRRVKVSLFKSDEELCAQLHKMTRDQEHFEKYGKPTFIILQNGALGIDNEKAEESELRYTGLYSDIRLYRSAKFASFMVLDKAHSQKVGSYLPQRLNHLLPRSFGAKEEDEDESDEGEDTKDNPDTTPFQVMPSYFALPRVNINDLADAQKKLRLYFIGLIGDLGLYQNFNIKSLGKKERAQFEAERLVGLEPPAQLAAHDLLTRPIFNIEILKSFAQGKTIETIARENRINPKRCFALIYEYLKEGSRAINRYDTRASIKAPILNQETSQALRDFFTAAPTLPPGLHSAHIMKLAFDFWGLDLSSDEANQWLKDNFDFLQSLAEAKGCNFYGNLGELTRSSEQASNGQAETNGKQIEVDPKNNSFTKTTKAPSVLIEPTLLKTYLDNIDAGHFSPALACKELAPRLGIKPIGEEENTKLSAEAVAESRGAVVDIILGETLKQNYRNTKRYLLLYTLLSEKSSTGLGQLLRKLDTNAENLSKISAFFNHIANHENLEITKRAKKLEALGKLTYPALGQIIHAVTGDDLSNVSLAKFAHDFNLRITRAEIGTVITRQAKAHGKLGLLLEELRRQEHAGGITQPGLETIVGKHLTDSFSYPTYRHFAEEQGITITNRSPGGGGKTSYVKETDVPAILGLANKYAVREQLTYDLLGDIIEFVSGHRYESHQSLYAFAKEHELIDRITHKPKPGSPRRTKGYGDPRRSAKTREKSRY